MSQAFPVRVALIDTGVASLPDIEPHILSRYEIQSGGRVIPRKEGEDLISHGTACADIVRRLAPEAGIVDLRVMTGYRDNYTGKLAAALCFAISQNYEVINIGVGQERWDQRVADLLDQAEKQNQVVIAAVDNRGDSMGFPASHPSVLGVDMEHFADDPSRVIASQDSKADVLAHGVYVEAMSPDGIVSRFTGSSFAAPHVAAAYAQKIIKQRRKVRTHSGAAHRFLS